MPHSGEGVGDIMSSYQKELEKYRDIDEDEILRTLSPEELEQLDCELQEMDPEVGALAHGTRGILQALGRVAGSWVSKTRAAYRDWSPKKAREKLIWRCFREPCRCPRSEGRSDLISKTHP